MMRPLWFRSSRWVMVRRIAVIVARVLQSGEWRQPYVSAPSVFPPSLYVNPVNCDASS
jgi:hypothetical protein